MEQLPCGVLTNIEAGTIYALPSIVGMLSSDAAIEFSTTQYGSFSALASGMIVRERGFIRASGNTIALYKKSGNQPIIATEAGLSYAELVVADSPSYYWRLNELTGTIARDIVGGAHGTISGGVTLGQSGALFDGDQAMTFDGVDDKIQTVVSITVPLVCSIEGWINNSVTGGSRNPMFSTRGLSGTGDFIAAGIAPLSNRTMVVDSTAVSAAGLLPVPTTGWHHVVYVLSGTSASIYLNGVFDRTQPFVRTTQYVGACTIGWDTGSAAGTGSLDEVAIYPRALNAQEILDHYNLGKR